MVAEREGREVVGSSRVMRDNRGEEEEEEEDGEGVGEAGWSEMKAMKGSEV